MNSQQRAVMTEDFDELLSRDLPWAELDGRSLLLSGATGLVGGYLTDFLLYRNQVCGSAPTRIVALVRDVDRARRQFATYASRADFALHLHNLAAPIAAMGVHDYVMHAAGNATPRSFTADPVGTYVAAALGTHHLLAYAAQVEARAFLLLSSGAVHGAVPGTDTTIDEQTLGLLDPLDAYACYGESKRAAETMCVAWTRQFGLRTRIARLGHSYGPGIRRDDDRAFAQFLYAVHDGHDIELHSDGSAVRPYCYLSDVVDGLLRILLSGEDANAYLLAHPEQSCSVLQLAEFIAGLRPETQVSVRSAPAPWNSVVNRDPARRLNISKLRALGWTPRVSYQDGFRRTFRSLG